MGSRACPDVLHGITLGMGLWTCFSVLSCFLKKMSYQFQSQSNSVPVYASDFCLSTAPRANPCFSKHFLTVHWSIIPLVQRHLKLSLLTVPSPPPSASTESVWPFLPHSVPRPLRWDGQDTLHHGSRSRGMLICLLRSCKKQHH